MGAIRELSERLLRGETTTAEVNPFALPIELESVADDVAFVSGFSNVGAIRTDEGLVLVDSGSVFFAAPMHEAVRRFSPSPLHTAVFTHGHVDHVFGLGPFVDEAKGKPRVVAHEAVPERFARYRLTAGYNGVVNARQFGIPLAWPTEYPDVDLTYRDALRLEVGGVGLELFHARGETDDHTFDFVPSRRVLFTGDLFIWATPNAGNPQKAQRYAREWAAALRRMEALDAEVLCPGHGPPIFGRGAVRLALSETAELLEILVEETLARLNAGATLDAILHEVRAPARLLERPYLRPVYDDPEFVVRNVARLYAGWWDGDPAELKPAPKAELAREIAALAGGATKLADRARELAKEGRLGLAGHLAELARKAAPDDATIAEAHREVYRARAAAEPSLMARAIFLSAARDR